MRKLGIGLLVGAAAAFFLRWRGGFSHAADVVTERLPEAAAPERTLEEDGPRDTAPLAGDPEDATLRDRVMSEVLSDERFKGNVNVATEYGRVVLHGELENPDLIDELVSAVRNVEGVRDVDSRLHLPHVEAQLPKRATKLEERL
jgi:osmotically-inducible protein OsmY